MKLRKRYIFLIIALMLIVLVFAIGGNKGNVTKVQTVAVTRGNVEKLISVSGTVQEKNENNVYLETAVMVKDILVDENEKVEKGQKIVEFDMDSLKSNLKTLKINKEVQELTYQKATISDESGMLSLVTTQNSMVSAKDSYERAEALYEVGGISKVEYENAKSAYENAKAGLELSQTGLTYDLEVMKKNIELTDIKIKDLEKQISKLNDAMYSPVSGIISSVNMDEGAYATSGAPIYKVIDNDNLEIKCEVKEFTIKNFKAGQKVYITGDAFEGNTYEGHIKSIAPVASAASGYTTSQTTIDVIIEVDSEDTLLKSGFNVTCDIIALESKDTLAIPVTSFNESNDGEVFVYKIENGVLKKTPIESGINSDEYLEVISGLTEGEKIVKTIKSSYSEGLAVAEER